MKDDRRADHVRHLTAHTAASDPAPSQWLRENGIWRWPLSFLERELKEYGCDCDLHEGEPL